MDRYSMSMERLNIVNVNFSKLDPRINKILIKIPASYYMDINKLTKV